MENEIRPTTEPIPGCGTVHLELKYVILVDFHALLDKLFFCCITLNNNYYYTCPKLTLGTLELLLDHETANGSKTIFRGTQSN